MEIVDKGLVYQTRVGMSGASAFFPSVTGLPDGKLIVTFRMGTGKESADGNICTSTSTDGGKTWSEPAKHFDKTWNGVSGSLWDAAISWVAENRLLAIVLWVERSDPSKPFFSPKTEGLLPTKNLLYESLDDGASWSCLGAIDTSPFEGPVTETGAILRMDNGVLAAHFELNKAYDDPRPWVHKAVMKFSNDGGKTWPEHSISACDPSGRLFYWDQRPTVLAENRLLDLFWTFDRKAGKDLAIHMSKSEDGGRTWAEPVDTGIEGQVAYPAALPDGRVFMAYVDRYHTRSIRARLSDDEGETWDAAPELVLWEAQDAPDQARSEGMGDYLQDMKLWTFGLPTCAVLPDGDVFVVYYAGAAEATNICWSRVRV